MAPADTAADVRADVARYSEVPSSADLLETFAAERAVSPAQAHAQAMAQLAAEAGR